MRILSGRIRTVTTVHDQKCPCLYRQVEVSGEFTVETPVQKRPSFLPPSPLTGFEMRVSDPPSKVIVNDLLIGFLPGCDVGVMLLGEDENDDAVEPARIPAADPHIPEAADLEFELTAEVA